MDRTILLLYLFVFTFFGYSYEIFDCNNRNDVILKVNEIAFFETTNFPKFMSIDDFDSCQLKFVLNETVGITKFQLVVVFLELSCKVEDFVSTDIIFDTYSNTFKYSLRDPFYSENIAQKGFVLFEKQNDGCPMESISREKPFELTDENQVFYVQSSYKQFFIRTKPCKWLFSSATEGYGFKVVVTHFTVSSETELRILNTTDILANEGNILTYHPYYNNDRQIQITLSVGDSKFVPKMEFQAYVTLVKNIFKESEDNCTVTTSFRGQKIWSNFGSGYKKNGYCIYEVKILNLTEVVVKITQLSLEENTDVLSISTDDDRIEYLNSLSTFALSPHKNGFTKTATFKFESDGSFESLGFEVEFTKNECACSNQSISCDDFTFTFTVMDDTDIYCGSLHCIFRVEPCDADFILLDFSPRIEGSELRVTDTYRIISNGEIVFKLNEIERDEHDSFVYLNSKNENFVEIITFPSLIVRSLTIYVETFEAPEVDLEIIFSSSDTNCIIDTGAFKLISINVENKTEKATFAVNTSAEGGALMFNNKSFTYHVSSELCYADPYPWRCEIKVNEFVVLNRGTDLSYPILAIQRLHLPTGCVFGDNIFPTHGQGNASIAALANNEKDFCVITIIIDEINGYYISHLWTTSKKEMVQVFVGTDLTKILLFEFNAKTQLEWTRIRFASPVYTVKIPKNTAFYMLLTLHTSYDRYFQDISEFPFKSLVTTPLYKISKKMPNIYGDDFLTYYIGNYTVKFTALDYFIPNGESFFFYSNNEKYLVNKTGDSVTFKNQNVILNYMFKPSNISTSGAFFFIETINDPR